MHSTRAVGERLLLVFLVLEVLLFQAESSHFRGGTISWKSLGGNKVHFFYRLGWAYSSGPGCTPSLIGKLVLGMSGSWDCQSNNCGTPILHGVNYICTGASQAEDWEQGEDNFTYTFPSEGPFTIGFSDGDWILLSNGKGYDPWNISTIVDLRTRSDIGKPNSSPKSLSKPMYHVQFDCEIHLKLPVIDPDDDVVRCRWAVGEECISVCDALPGAYLDEETCTLIFNTSSTNKYIEEGIYAVAITIEDFPRVPMTLGGKVKRTPSDALSSITMQFLISTIPKMGPCDAGPRFVPSTPEKNEVVTVQVGNTASVDIYADNRNDTSAKANDITSFGLVSSSLSPVIPDAKRSNTFTTTLTWKTAQKDLGEHIVCLTVTNDKLVAGEQRCFIISVVEKGCMPPPCKNNGKCVAKNGKYKCTCRIGFSGQNCEINIDDCVSNACPPGTYCVDGINAYTCRNITHAPTTTAATTTTTKPVTTTEKNYTGMCPLEYEHCDCTMRPNRNYRTWMGLSTEAREFLCGSFGFPIGLVLSIITFFLCIRPCEKHSGKKQLVAGRRHPYTKMGDRVIKLKW